jgi:NitT/TauT family transport system permease protein
MKTPRVMYEVVILGTMAQALDVLRSCSAISWVMLASVEGLVRSEGGLGAMLLNNDKYFNLTAVFGIQLVILLVGLLFDQSIVAARRFFCPYSYLTIEKR